MKKSLFVVALSSFPLFVSGANATPVVISDVPAYYWYHGCGPTVVASVFGYYDLHGYDNLFNASGWNSVSKTANIRDEISSPEHNAKYDPVPDVSDSILPEPPDTSIADFLHTSENTDYGWTWFSNTDNAFVNYADYKGYTGWVSWVEYYNSFTFDILKDEIDNNYPLLFAVDTDGSGGTDHIVSVVGYNDETMQYGAFTSWKESETVEWFDYRPAGYGWGIGAATFIRPGAPDVIDEVPATAAVPEPASMILFGTGLAGLLGFRIRKSKGGVIGLSD